jgi:anti-sigma-K factor RskA
MTPHADSRQAFRQYLLGTLPPEERPTLEERLLTDESAYEELLLEEEELLDDYVAEALSPEESERFERNFLCTEERRRQLDFARALGRYVARNATAEPAGEARAAGPTFGERLRAFWGGWGLRAALAVGVAAFVIGALWFTWRPGTPRTFATLTLAAAAGDRAEGIHAEKVKLPLEADALRLRLTLPEGTPGAQLYRVELRARGGEPERFEAEGQDERSVSVVVPASRLRRGQYTLKLFTVAPDGTERRVGGSYDFDAE